MLHWATSMGYDDRESIMADSNTKPAIYLGLDVGGTKSAAVIGTASGQVLDRVEWPSHAQRGPDAMIQQMVDHAQELIEKLDSDGQAPCGVGVAIGGPLDANEGVIFSPPNLPGWDAVPLKNRLAQALNLPVSVEHDASACALAEHRWGAGRDVDSLVYLTCGTGLGAGFVFHGHIHRGAQGRPSDIGHMRYRDDGPDAYGKPGCVEGFCAGSSLGRLASWRFPQRWADQPPSSQHIAQLADTGDQNAREIIELNAQAVGDLCAVLADMLYPQLIVLGSLAQYLGQAWLERVREHFAQEAHAEAQRLCRIEPAGLGPRLQDCSALVAAMAIG